MISRELSHCIHNTNPWCWFSWFQCLYQFPEHESMMLIFMISGRSRCQFLWIVNTSCKLMKHDRWIALVHWAPIIMYIYVFRFHVVMFSSSDFCKNSCLENAAHLSMLRMDAASLAQLSHDRPGSSWRELISARMPAQPSSAHPSPARPPHSMTLVGRNTVYHMSK